MGKRILGIFLTAVLILAMGLNAYATNGFVDISDSWAKVHIKKMSDLGVITGYTIENKKYYKPGEQVSKIEALVMIYRTLEETGDLKSKADHTSEYQSIMKSNGIPSWAYKYVAYGLKTGMIVEDELKVFMSNGVQNDARRVDAAIFWGKAMNMSLDPIIILKYNDASSVPTVARPYVDLLYKKNIMTGDGDNNFNPTKKITRAEFATIASREYELLKTVDVVDQDEIIEEENKEQEKEKEDEDTDENKNNTIEITIEKINDEKGIFVKDEDKDIRYYFFSEDTEIIIQGEKKEIKDLDEDDQAVITFDENGNLEKIEIGYEDGKFEGQVYSVTNNGDVSYLKVRDKTSRSKILFVVNSDTEIEEGNKTIRLKDLEKGDAVTLLYEKEDNSRVALEITLESKTTEYMGILYSEIEFDEDPYLKIKLNNGETIKLDLDDDVDVELNDKNSKLSKLKVGDIVTVETEYDKIVEIEAIRLDQDDDDEIDDEDGAGYITAISFGNSYKITVSDEDGKEKEYKVNEDAQVKMDGYTRSVEDLRLNYYVIFEIDDDEIVKVEAEKSGVEIRLIGKIEKIYEDFDVIKLSYIYKTAGKRTPESVKIDSHDTQIYDTIKWKNLDLDDLGKNDVVYIEGKYDGSEFVAKKVLVVE